MEMTKYEWDRDYHTVTGQSVVTSLADIEDDWTGYNYWYEIPTQKHPLNAEEAREWWKKNKGESQ